MSEIDVFGSNETRFEPGADVAGHAADRLGASPHDQLVEELRAHQHAFHGVVTAAPVHGGQRLLERVARRDRRHRA